LLNQLTDEDRLMLVEAVQKGRTSMVAACVAAGFPVNTTDSQGATALHFAAIDGRAKIVRMLLAAGADTTIRDKEHSSTPMGWACWGADFVADADGDYADSVRALLEAGARKPQDEHTAQNPAVRAVLEEFAQRIALRDELGFSRAIRIRRRRNWLGSKWSSRRRSLPPARPSQQSSSKARDTVGGGLRSAELTLPGFVHDVCSSVLPMGVASPFFFRALPLDTYGMEWVTPRASRPHPLDNGDVSCCTTTSSEPLRPSAMIREAYWRTIGTIARDWPRLESDLLAPLGFPTHPLHYARFGLQALLPASTYGENGLLDSTCPGTLCWCAAHSLIPRSHRRQCGGGTGARGGGHAHGWASGTRRLAVARERARGALCARWVVSSRQA
jgi:hypothetical protein